MNVILRSTTMLGKEEWGVRGPSGYCILVDTFGKKLKEERSKILWNKITNCWDLQEAVNFEYRRRMPMVSPMCHESGTERWQSNK